MNIYEKTTARIISQLENGVCPWAKPWNNVNIEAFNNPVTGTRYSGINVFLLFMFSRFENPKFVTFKQAKKAGGTVKKGEKGIPITYFSWITKDHAGKWIDASDRPEDEDRKPVLKGYTVFSVEQCEGLPEQWYEVKQPEGKFNRFENIKKADQIIAKYRDKPQIKHSFSNRAFYRPSDDSISMPDKTQFVSPEKYYSTIFHELAHSTGHKSRLNRAGISDLLQTREEYGQEELVAEMTASFLSGKAGFEDRIIEHSVAYLDSWLKILKQPKNAKMIVHAAGQATKAADYIQGKQSTKKQAA